MPRWRYKKGISKEWRRLGHGEVQSDWVGRAARVRGEEGWSFDIAVDCCYYRMRSPSAFYREVYYTDIYVLEEAE